MLVVEKKGGPGHLQTTRRRGPFFTKPPPLVPACPWLPDISTSAIYYHHFNKRSGEEGRTERKKKGKPHPSTPSQRKDTTHARMAAAAATGAVPTVHLRVCVSGSSATGKSSLIYRLVEGKFNGNACSTINVDFAQREDVTSDGPTLSTTFADLAGQERFRASNALSYRGVCAVLVVFDVTTAPKFDTNEPYDVPYWIRLAKERAGQHVPVIVVANKIDAVRGNDVDEAVRVSFELQSIREDVEATAYAGRIYRVSAKTGEGTAELLSDIQNIEKMTEDFQSAAIRASTHAGYRLGDDITGDAPPALPYHALEPLLCVVPGVEGLPRVVRERGLVNLRSDPPSDDAAASAALLTGASSPAPFSEARRVEGSPRCAC